MSRDFRMWASSRTRGAALWRLKPCGPSLRRSLAASASSPAEEGGLEFPTRRYPSFWTKLKQQKHGLGNMALSASICFLAVGIIKQDKELTRATEAEGRLRQENQALQETLRSVLAKSEDGGGHVAKASEDKNDDSLQAQPGTKFMV